MEERAKGKRQTVLGDTLTVHLNPEDVGNARIEIYIKLPRVKHVTIAGSGIVEVVDGIKSGAPASLCHGRLGFFVRNHKLFSDCNHPEREWYHILHPNPTQYLCFLLI
jgi:hypothetical protein